MASNSSPDANGRPLYRTVARGRNLPISPIRPANYVEPPIYTAVYANYIPQQPEVQQTHQQQPGLQQTHQQQPDEQQSHQATTNELLKELIKDQQSHQATTNELLKELIKGQQSHQATTNDLLKELIELNKTQANNFQKVHLSLEGLHAKMLRMLKNQNILLYNLVKNFPEGYNNEDDDDV
ncbi:unnamed protein product [Adineta ricciae]|uniref:Uncharacterized protein n=1 Tax=Adineta ricciae TaxID=249248 RepID=A0A815REF9_ADIRI|nr:unnamed protein product [Adineta ricciae]CAF1652593.1 unnamed protein product [Adineta ricciae]